MSSCLLVGSTELSFGHVEAVLVFFARFSRVRPIGDGSERMFVPDWNVLDSLRTRGHRTKLAWRSNTLCHLDFSSILDCKLTILLLQVQKREE